MTRLPPPLARWAVELSGLPDELVATLAPWLGRLALAIGGMPGERAAPVGELDGVEGLSRRGSYQRLVIGEWAIADQWPDEFLRRAAGGEHLFIARAHRAPPAARRSVVLISAGPSQLGAPRLVHVAALVVMARRASGGGAALAWGVLERPEDGLLTDVDPVAIELLLAARTATVAGGAQVTGWRAQVAAGDEVWVIGGDEAIAAAGALVAAALVVRDPFEPAAGVVEVEVIDRGAARPRARVRLPLPAPDDGARLIRDPLRRGGGAQRVTTAAAPSIGAVWFANGGRRLAVDLGDRYEVWPVPSSPREPVGKPRRIVKLGGMTLVALGMRRRHLFTVRWLPGTPDKLWLDLGPSHRDDLELALPEAVIAMMRSGRPLARSTPGLLAYAQLGAPDTPLQLVLEGPCGTMLAMRPDAPPPIRAMVLGVDSDVEDAEVVGAAITAEGVLFAQVTAGGVVDLRLASRSGVRSVGQVMRRGIGEVERDAGVRWGFATPDRAAWGPVAVRIDARRWEVRSSGAPAVTIESEARVWGAITGGGEPRLVGDDDDRRRLVLRGAGGATVPLPRASGEIVTAACATAHPVLAWATADEVVVYSMAWDAVLMRVAR